MDEKIISKKREEQDIVSCDQLPDSEQTGMMFITSTRSITTMLRRRARAYNDPIRYTPWLVSRQEVIILYYYFKFDFCRLHADPGTVTEICHR